AGTRRAGAGRLGRFADGAEGRRRPRAGPAALRRGWVQRLASVRLPSGWVARPEPRRRAYYPASVSGQPILDAPGGQVRARAPLAQPAAVAGHGRHLTRRTQPAAPPRRPPALPPAPPSPRPP